MVDEGAAVPLAAEDLLGKVAFDVNGHRLGRVEVCRETDEGLVSFDVRLSRRVRRAWRAPRSVTFGPDDVVAFDEDVSLDDDAAHLLRPGVGAPRI